MGETPPRRSLVISGFSQCIGLLHKRISMSAYVSMDLYICYSNSIVVRFRWRTSSWALPSPLSQPTQGDVSAQPHLTSLCRGSGRLGRLLFSRRSRCWAQTVSCPRGSLTNTQASLKGFRGQRCIRVCSAPGRSLPYRPWVARGTVGEGGGACPACLAVLRLVSARRLDV